MTTRADVLRRQLASMADELAKLESRPQEPPPGAVIQFEMFFPRRRSTCYEYAAINAGGSWYTTGNGPQSATWDALLDWMMQGVTSFRILGLSGPSIPTFDPQSRR